MFRMNIVYYEGFKDINLSEIYKHREFDNKLIQFLEKKEIKTIKQFLERVSFNSLILLDNVFNEPWGTVPCSEIDDLHNYCKLFLLPKMNYEIADIIYDSYEKRVFTLPDRDLCNGLNLSKECVNWFNKCYKKIKLPWISYAVE